MGHRVVDVEQIEPAGPGGAVRFVRRELGTRAFGINQFVLEPGFAGPEHDEETTGQEEVYIVIGGGGAVGGDGAAVALPDGRVAHAVPRTPPPGAARPAGLVFMSR